MSRVFVGLIIVVISLLSRIFKWNLLEKDVQEIANIIAEAGGAIIIWWGRVKSEGTQVNLFGMYKKVVPPLLVVFLLGGCSVFCALDTQAAKENLANVEQIVTENAAHAPTDPDLAKAQQLRNNAALDLAKKLVAR